MTQTQFHASKKEFKKEVCMCGGWGGGGVGGVVADTQQLGKLKQSRDQTCKQKTGKTETARPQAQVNK